MNRTIKDATVKAFHYQDLESLTAHVIAFALLLHVRDLSKRSTAKNLLRSTATD